MADRYKVLHNMKTARQKGVETIINPAPAIPLPAEAYEGLGHLIVNETEAAILSGIEIPTSWDEVAAVFISRGVQNVIITLGGEVSRSNCRHSLHANASTRVSSTRPRNNRQSRRTVVQYQHERSRLSIPQLLATLLQVLTPLLWHIGNRFPREPVSISMQLLHTPTELHP